MFGKKQETKAETKPTPPVTAPQGAPAGSAAAPNDSTGPLFYRDPQPLAATRHANVRLRPGNLTFAAETNSSPIVASEFAEAARFYPILFAGERPAPVVLLGLEGVNTFVADGVWEDGKYMPAYVRRYPFVFISEPGGDRFALGVDMGAPHITESGEGELLFQDGQPSQVTQQALAFCQAFQADHAATRAFGEALRERDMLVDRRADIILPGGRGTILQGFKVIDPARLAALKQDDVLAWHRNGWLALAHLHLASLGAFRDLLRRHGAGEAQLRAN